MERKGKNAWKCFWKSPRKTGEIDKYVIWTGRAKKGERKLKESRTREDLIITTSVLENIIFNTNTKLSSTLENVYFSIGNVMEKKYLQI